MLHWIQSKVDIICDDTKVACSHEPFSVILFILVTCQYKQGRRGYNAHMGRNALPSYLAIRFDNTNVEIVQWSRAAPCPSSYDAACSNRQNIPHVVHIKIGASKLYKTSLKK